MKVLFLDIDGVLNCDTTKERIRAKGYNGLRGIDATLRDRFLNWWHDKDVALVLSSMWRYHKKMIAELHDNGLVFIDKTKGSSANCWITTHIRGDEIQDWLSQHPEVTHYAILDDNDWYRGRQRDRFIQTDPERGLQASDLVMLDRLLGYVQEVDKGEAIADPSGSDSDRRRQSEY
jgi:hypothetical protein